MPTPAALGDLQTRIDAHPFWYHTIDVAPGVTTPGWFDLRPILDRMPWPDAEGKRCLDIGTFDGQLAFELERRGAAEVVAIDIADHRLWDWPADFRPGQVANDQRFVAFDGPPKGEGFRLLAEAMGSTVQWMPLSIYDLNPADMGTFDVVVCGSLLLHLRDPIGALEAVRSVCHGVFLSAEEIDLRLTVAGKGRPLARLNGSGAQCQWWIPNAAGHHRMVTAAGFEIERSSRPYVVRFNKHPRPTRTAANLVDAALRRAVCGTADPGVVHRALLAHPQP